MASRPSRSISQKARGLFAPGNRQLMPMMATGSIGSPGASARLLRGRCRRGGRMVGHPWGRLGNALGKMLGHERDGRIVPDQRRRQAALEPLLELPGETNGGPRIETVIAEGLVNVDLLGGHLEMCRQPVDQPRLDL